MKNDLQEALWGEKSWVTMTVFDSLEFGTKALQDAYKREIRWKHFVNGTYQFLLSITLGLVSVLCFWHYPTSRYPNAFGCLSLVCGLSTIVLFVLSITRFVDMRDAKNKPGKPGLDRIALWKCKELQKLVGNLLFNRHEDLEEAVEQKLRDIGEQAQSSSNISVVIDHLRLNFENPHKIGMDFKAADPDLEKYVIFHSNLLAHAKRGGRSVAAEAEALLKAHADEHV